MLDYKLIEGNLDDVYAQLECAVARLMINLNELNLLPKRLQLNRIDKGEGGISVIETVRSAYKIGNDQFDLFIKDRSQREKCQWMKFLHVTS